MLKRREAAAWAGACHGGCTSDVLYGANKVNVYKRHDGKQRGKGEAGACTG
jgi:hypothetical protein